jgi:high-affinity iron transporter
MHLRSVASYTVAILAALLFSGPPARGAEPREIVHLLDYIAQDYSAAVADGAVINAEELAEMREFSASAVRLGAELPQLAADPAIGRELRALADLVEQRASPPTVAAAARRIKEQVIQRTHLAVAPSRWPSLEAGAALYQQACAACHGKSGLGDGPVAGTLDPKPSNFHDRARMRELAPFQAFNTIRLGVQGTAMPSFGSLRDDEAWALAFYVVSLRYQEAGAAAPRGEPLELAIAASESDRQLEERLGGNAAATLAATRLHSGLSDPGQSLAVAIRLLREAEAAYRAGDAATARSKALAAYLDGVEPAEARIRVVEPGMTVEIERRMSAVRAAIEQQQPAARVASTVRAATKSIQQIEKRLQGNSSSPWLVFSMAAAIVLREGFEAILIIVSILSVLRAVGARHAAKWVHAGWVSALALGVLAWLLSDRLLQSSGLSREVLEAATSLLAVAVLLYLGIWLHRRTQIGRWKAFIEDQVTSALSSRKLFGLTVISFLAVFREAIETVLFLVALSMEGGVRGRQMLAAGVIVSIGCTILLAWALVRFSARLPLRTIFGATSIVMIAMAVILAGKGARALQEIGAVPVTQAVFDYRVDLLGFFPTVETLLSQAVIAVLAAVLWFRARGKSARMAGSV